MTIAAVPVATVAKIVAVLFLALAISIGGNVWQLWHAGVSAGRAEGENQREVLQSRVTELGRAAAVNGAIAKVARADSTALLNDLAVIAERGRTERVVYRRAAAAAPLPVNCQPGQGRMDAVNAALGPNPEPSR